MFILKLQRASISFLIAILLATVIPGQTASPERTTFTIRGQKQEIHFYPARGTRLNQKALFLPGIGGWRGWAITVAQTMSSWGYDVYGFDSKSYLDSFTGKTSLKETDVMNDLRQAADWMTNRSGERVALVGWSEGAGLALLGAAGENNKKTFTGLITFGLGDENVIGWHWLDNLTSLTGKVPKEPTFSAAEYIAKIAPLPLFLIQSGHDEYTPLDEAKKLFALAREPKRFVLVEAKNHRFDGNQEEFFQKLHEGLQWISQTR